MAVITSTVLDNSQQTKYLDKYIYHMLGRNVWDQFTTPDWEVMSSRAGNPGKTFSLAVLERLDPQPTALPEDSDVAGVTFADALTSVTMYEYGNGVDMNLFFRETAFYDVDGATAKLLAENMTETRELLARYAYLSGSRIWYPSGAAALTTLDHTNSSYTLSYKHLLQLKNQAQAINMPAFADGSYVTVIHPSASYDLMNDSLWENLGVYADNSMLWDGTAASLQAGAKFQGEIGRLAGIRVCESTYGKVLYSSGATAQAATTLNDATCNAGDTTIVVTSGTNLSNGDYISIGTLATADTEQVLITSGGGTANLTIQGVGNTRNNLGLKYDHDDGAAVTEASQVVELPIIGPDSVTKVWHEHTDNDGLITIEEKKGLNVSGRFWTYSWIGWWGYAVTQENFLIKGRFAVTQKTPGYIEKL